MPPVDPAAVTDQRAAGTAATSATVRTTVGDDVGTGRHATAGRRSDAGVRRVMNIVASLVGTQAVTNVIGLVFWTVAARQSSVAAVGVAGAAVSLMLLIGSFGMLGLGTLLMAEIPRIAPAHRRQLVRTSLLVATVASTVLGGLAAAWFGMAGSVGTQAIGAPINVLDFAIGTGLTGLTMVLDQAVLVVGRSRLQLERNTVASVTKIGFLIALDATGNRSGMAIFFAWTLGNAVSLLLVAYRTRPARRAERSRLFDVGLVRRLAPAAASHHALNIVLQAPILLLSVVVALVLTAQDNGLFSTARSIAGFVFVLPFSVTIALFAASAGRADELLARMRLTIPFGLAASVVADIVLWPLGKPVLEIFGHSYSTGALTTLRIIVLAGIPFVIKDHFIALRRVQNRTGNAAVIALGGAVVELVAAVIGARIDGTTGLCIAWVGALTIEAALLSVVLVKAMRTVASPIPTQSPDYEFAGGSPAQAAGL